MWGQATKPPETPRKPVEDTYHGVKVVDEYRWLENGKDAAVSQWTRAQSERTRSYIQSLASFPRLRERIEQIITKSSVSYGSLQWRETGWFALKRDPAKQQPLLVLMSSLEAGRQERTLMDPNTLQSGALASIDWFEASHDGKLLAVSVSRAGSESGDVQILETATAKPVYEMIPRVNGGTAGGDLAWTPDAKGIYYTRYPRGTERPTADMDFYQQVYFHQLGTPAENDRYELGKDAPRIAEFRLQTHAGSGRILASMQNGDSGEFIHYVREPQGEWRQISRYADRIVQMTFAPGGELYGISRLGAPRGKIVRIGREARSAQVLVPEGEAAVISDFYSRISPFLVTEKHIFASYQLGGPEEIRRFDRTGKQLRGPEGLPVSTTGQPTPGPSGEVAFDTLSYLAPAEWRLFSTTTGKTRQTDLRVKPAVDFSDCEALREVAVSKDGTKVPVTILKRRGLALDGSNPARLTGYGGFGVSISPGFNPTLRPLLDAGFVIAIANLRGGGEFGQQWHDQGRLTRKQNVFDDFAAAMKHLSDRGYTNPAKLAIEGGSNGGLLMGAMITQHPELCRAVVAHVGIYDMLRVELTPNGAFNTVEYGSVKEQDQFAALYAYSPFHHVQAQTQYPAVLFLTGENDARVDPMHSRKMTARLQATGTQNPVYLLTDPDAGHGSGKPQSARIDEVASVYAFLMDQLKVKAP